MAKISILVPVYNTGKYIERCLNSIVNQTNNEEIEIIIVNDGSTDNSEEVIKKYMETYSKVTNIAYFAKENEGVAKTRNFAIEKATSEYLLFVDSDDYISTDLVEKLEPYMEQKNDLIKFKLQRVNEKGEVLEKVDGPIFEQQTGEKAFHQLFSQDVLLDSPCVYVIKKELLTKNHFKFRQTYHEDFGLIPLILLSAKTVVSIDEYLYFYVQVENSITRNEDYQRTLKKMEDALAHYDYMLQAIEKMELTKIAKEDIKIYYTNAIILKLEELKPKEQKEYIKQIRKRKMSQNIKARNIKQWIKKMLLKINIKLYLKVR